MTDNTIDNKIVDVVIFIYTQLILNKEKRVTPWKFDTCSSWCNARFLWKWHKVTRLHPRYHPKNTNSFTTADNARGGTATAWVLHHTPATLSRRCRFDPGTVSLKSSFGAKTCTQLTLNKEWKLVKNIRTRVHHGEMNAVWDSDTKWHGFTGDIPHKPPTQSAILTMHLAVLQRPEHYSTHPSYPPEYAGQIPGRFSQSRVSAPKLVRSVH